MEGVGPWKREGDGENSGRGEGTAYAFGEVPESAFWVHRFLKIGVVFPGAGDTVHDLDLRAV